MRTRIFGRLFVAWDCLGMTKRELLELQRAHVALFERDGLFASAVIAKAAQQVASMKVD